LHQKPLLCSLELGTTPSSAPTYYMYVYVCSWYDLRLRLRYTYVLLCTVHCTAAGMKHETG
jgi:hypothetical protein